MFKKALYPLTDWNWLKLPLAALAGGGLALIAGLSAVGSLAYHRDHLEASMSAAFSGYAALFLMYIVVALACYGYLARVARQPLSEEPLKLPKWSGVGSLIKDGILITVALFLTQLFFGLLVETVLMLGVAVFGGLGAFLHGQSFEATGLFVGLAGTGVVLALGVALVFTAIVVFGLVFPLLLVRYAQTGKFRHLFSYRWAWNAFTIAPWEYLMRGSIWVGFLTTVTILTPLTAGGAYLIGVVCFPLFVINNIYLVGDYYKLYLND